jgi:signal transduction histidine kinase
VIDELILEQKTRADFMKVGIRTDFSGKPFIVEADRNMIQRVILNLLDNALKFSTDGDEIILALKFDDDNNVELRVADKGPGIIDDQKQRVFERFAQVSNNSKSGAGLGLTFCRLAVEAHKGKIFVEDNKGKGAVFVMKIPLRVENE